LASLSLSLSLDAKSNAKVKYAQKHINSVEMAEITSVYKG
jgi:hypothetical protein